jgi:hypothetical protein
MTKEVSTEEHVGELRKRLAENPGCALTHYNLGIALTKQHRWDDAIIGRISTDYFKEGRYFDDKA